MRYENKCVCSSGHSVTASPAGGGIAVSVTPPPNGAPCAIHWGLAAGPDAPWSTADVASPPAGSTSPDGVSFETPIMGIAPTVFSFEIKQGSAMRVFCFALRFTGSGQWDNNGGKNYILHIEAPNPVDTEKALEDPTPEGERLSAITIALDDGERLSAAVTRNAGTITLSMATTHGAPPTLHWGVARRHRAEWSAPDAYAIPEGSTRPDENAVRTKFALRENESRLSLSFPSDSAPLGVQCVLISSSGEWIKQKGRNIFIPLGIPSDEGAHPHAPALDEIIDAESNKGSWTLMHRFNLAYGLLDSAGQTPNGMALIYVWLRFSAIRQLDWQRNYNTKPRELSHAQDRFSLKLASMYHAHPESRELIRMTLSTVGRGGDGQRIRDEILNIMHRHHIKEVTGHFLEEWHQKLHNNTTPDDIAICRAYLDFLRSDGSRDTFYHSLSLQGVTRDRLRSFERPITSEPDFVPHLKWALIHDFEAYLGVLKSVHAAADLDIALNESYNMLGPGDRDAANHIASSRGAHGEPPLRLAESVTKLRRSLASYMARPEADWRARTMLYLDLSLEEYLRTIVERAESLPAEELPMLLTLAIENAYLSTGMSEFDLSRRQWEAAMARPATDARDRALRLYAATERLSRAVGTYVDSMYAMLQPNASAIGAGVRIDDWAVRLFSEEVVRGRPPFVLSFLLRHIEPRIRKEAGIKPWLVISPAEVIGTIETVDALSSVTGKTYATPTIIIAERVKGEEEPPAGAAAIITPHQVDLVSHVAVRTRNAKILFACCLDRELYDSLRELAGSTVRLSTSASGDVRAVRDVSVAPETRVIKTATIAAHPPAAGPHPFVLAEAGFARGLVGGKALHLAALRKRLPSSISIPPAVAIPFRVFEQVTALPSNREFKKRHEGLVESLGAGHDPKLLGELRTLIKGLVAPEGFIAALKETLAGAGMELPKTSQEAAWKRVLDVWASKWNDRAVLSRLAWGIPHEALYMSVLIQPLVPAEYSFVSHTTHPATGDSDTLYAEAAAGLGEAIVANYPGRALAFTYDKRNGEPSISSYPSKHACLISSGGLVFRSDSNGEDIEGYAGAGLYDSVYMTEPVARDVDYSAERIMTDDAFLMALAAKIAGVSVEIEKALGGPQDIEGAYAEGNIHVLQARPQAGL